MNDFFVLIQARNGSTRLPGKMSLPFYNEETILHIIIDNLLKNFNKKNIILATTENEEDKPLIDYAKSVGIKYFKGDENDVLKRFIDCSEYFSVSNLVRVCADNPFLDSKYILPLMQNLVKNELEYISYQWWDETPVMLSHIGLFAECMTLDFLKRINSYTNDEYYHEHVSNYIYEHKDKFKFEFIALPKMLKGKQNYRLTVDTIDDFNLSQEIYYQLKQRRNEEDNNLDYLLEIVQNNPTFISKMKMQIRENEK